MKRLAVFKVDVLFDLVTSESSKARFLADDGEIYTVRTRSARYLVFHQNPNCVICGLKGTKMILEQPFHQQDTKAAHFNLYGENEYGELILMTKDHVLPSAKGGDDRLDNYQCMCAICNGFKKDRIIPNETLIEEIRQKRAQKDLPVQEPPSILDQPPTDKGVKD